MVTEEFVASAICFRMNINDEEITSAASQPLCSDTHNEASISQLISPGIVPSSQPLLLSDQSRVEIVNRHRVGRRGRRRRRAQGQPQQLAQQIRRRHMANQYHQQQQYHRKDRYEGRARSEDTRPPPSTVDEQFEEVIGERLQAVYDWEIMQLMEQLEQEQLNGLEGIAALEHLSVAQDEMEQTNQIQIAQTLEEEQHHTRTDIPPDWIQTQFEVEENHLTSQSLHSLVNDV
jgi:hypothetical protein